MKRILLLTVWMSLFGTITMSAQEEKRWSINVSGGYMATTDFMTDMGVFNVGVQRHLSKHFSWGGGTGAYYCDGVIVPVYADVRGYYPIEDTKFSLIGIARTGAGIHTGWGTVIVGGELLPGAGVKITDSSFLHLNIGLGFYDGDIMGTIQLGYSLGL